MRMYVRVVTAESVALENPRSRIDKNATFTSTTPPPL